MPFWFNQVVDHGFGCRPFESLTHRLISCVALGKLLTFLFPLSVKEYTVGKIK